MTVNQVLQGLVSDDGCVVDPRAYTEEAVFELELDLLWTREWVFIGHESEVPAAGAYVTRVVGNRSIVVLRDEDQAVRAFFNRCPHRGSQLLAASRGVERHIRCPYHGWTFATSGRCIGQPFAQAGAPSASLTPVGGVASAHGFVFACLDAPRKSLSDHLGEASETLERVVALAPDGEISIAPVWLKHRIHANWKAVAENAMDGYHPRIAHRAVIPSGGEYASEYTDRSLSRTIAHEGGHSEIDHRPKYREEGGKLQWAGGSRGLERYEQALYAARGKEEGERLLLEGPPTTFVFPNLIIAEHVVLALHPLTVDTTVQAGSYFVYHGAPALNRRVRQKAQAIAGPAGAVLSDDAEMAEFAQRGLKHGDAGPVVLRRGVASDPGRNFPIEGGVTDEVPQQAFWRHYGALLRFAR